MGLWMAAHLRYTHFFFVVINFGSSIRSHGHYVMADYRANLFARRRLMNVYGLWSGWVIALLVDRGQYQSAQTHRIYHIDLAKFLCESESAVELAPQADWHSRVPLKSRSNWHRNACAVGTTERPSRQPFENVMNAPSSSLKNRICCDKIFAPVWLKIKIILFECRVCARNPSHRAATATQVSHFEKSTSIHMHCASERAQIHGSERRASGKSMPISPKKCAGRQTYCHLNGWRWLLLLLPLVGPTALPPRCRCTVCGCLMLLLPLTFARSLFAWRLCEQHICLMIGAH